MRNKTRLAVAITAALGANFASTLVQAGAMSNASCYDNSTASTATSTCVSGRLDAAGGSTKPYLAIVQPTGTTTTTTNSRVHVPTSGIVYASELFAGSTNKDTFIIPNETTDYTGASSLRAAVTYEIKGQIDRGFELTFTLDNAKFATKPYPSLATNATLVSIDGSTACGATGCELKSTNWKDSGKRIVFSLEASTSPYLTNGAVFGLMYNLTGAGTLDTQGNEIKMTAKLALPFPNDSTLVESTETITVAKSKKATSVTITPAATASEGKLRISVATNNTKFSGTGTGFISASQGVIGFLKLTSEANVKNQTGYKDWAIGDSEKAGTQSESGTKVVYSTLQITNGQFAASKTGSAGKVYVNTTGTNAQVIAADTVDETNAVWNLSDTALKSLATSAATPQIIVQADGTNQINAAAEAAPTAVMTIQYVATKGKTVSEAVELRKIPLDGSRCVAYNIPNSKADDELSVRIINPTSATGSLIASLYGIDGTAIFENKDLLNDSKITSTKVLGKLSPWESVRISATDLEKINGDKSWDQRGVMIISSTLPKLEVYNLLRPKKGGTGIPRPLTNVSTGASGVACQY